MTSFQNRFQSGTNLSLPVACILLGILILSFFTYDGYRSYIEKNDRLASETDKGNQTKLTIDRLNALRATSETASGKLQKERYAGTFREDQILESLFSLVGSGISIGSVSMGFGERLPIGLSLAGITLSVAADNVEALNGYIDALTGTAGNRRYMIKGLSFPMDTNNLASPVIANLQL